jgi:hypothetical protein
MHYLTNYYKNICEQLQERINILEGRYKKAMRLGHKYPELLDRAADVYHLKRLEAMKADTKAKEKLKVAQKAYEKGSKAMPENSSYLMSLYRREIAASREEEATSKRLYGDDENPKNFGIWSVHDEIFDRIDDLTQGTHPTDTNPTDEVPVYKVRNT